MTEVLLSKALKEFLLDALGEIHLKAPVLDDDRPLGSLELDDSIDREDASTEVTTVHIYEGFVPSEDQDSSYFPYISIFETGGSIDQTNAICNVQLDCGVYSDEESGHLALLNLMRRVMVALNTLQDGALAKRFLLRGGIEWEIGSVDKGQYFNGVISLSFSYYVPKIPNNN